MKVKKIIDISQRLNEQTVIYPNNPPLSIKMKKGGETWHSVISMGSHTGTHIDTERHLFEGMPGVGSLDLSRVVGECRVIDFTKSIGQAIETGDVKSEKIKRGDRVLARTKNSLRGFSKWYDDYTFLSPDAAEYLATKGIALFGIDSLSVKKRGGSQRPHTALLEKGIPILEGLNLKDVKAGTYFLVAAPLSFDDIDGSPVRALLLRV